jgi:predicted XRE-type DNA-binding protein
MSEEFELTRGSGNVFRDLGHPQADAEHLKAILAAQIVKVLDGRGLTVRKAEEISGVAAADFSRIRQARLERFTIDRLMAVLARFDQRVEIKVSVKPRLKKQAGRAAA